jgi:hypothetical protein
MSQKVRSASAAPTAISKRSLCSSSPKVRLQRSPLGALESGQLSRSLPSDRQKRTAEGGSLRDHPPPHRQAIALQDRRSH